MTREAVQGGVTAPRGFAAAGVACGVKPAGLDLALVVSDRPAAAAGVFTTSLAAAPPVLLSREHLQLTGGRAWAIVVNSGCANACTGPAGLEAARLMAIETARAVGCDAEEVLVASTGVIGVRLDSHRVSRGIIEAAGALSPAHHERAARAILTTDRGLKERAVRVDTPAGTFTVGGMAKGAGMIEPNMATMLGFLSTDAEVSPPLLRRALVEACAGSFNAITVDGDCSTNDSVFALANGASGVVIGDRDHAALAEALAEVSRDLALEIVRGAEGATKLVTVCVGGAASPEDARKAARAIANSLLVKTAVHGGDPNWGRIVAAAARSGAGFSLGGARVALGGIVLFENGRPYDERAAQAAVRLRESDVTIDVDLGAGGHHGTTVWTCDLSAEYVRINGEYRT